MGGGWCGEGGACGSCRHFLFLTDDEAAGVCDLEMLAELGVECHPTDALDWAYLNCKRPQASACGDWDDVE